MQACHPQHSGYSARALVLFRGLASLEAQGVLDVTQQLRTGPQEPHVQWPLPFTAPPPPILVQSRHECVLCSQATGGREGTLVTSPFLCVCVCVCVCVLSSSMKKQRTRPQGSEQTSPNSRNPGQGRGDTHTSLCSSRSRGPGAVSPWSPPQAPARPHSLRTAEQLMLALTRQRSRSLRVPEPPGEGLLDTRWCHGSVGPGTHVASASAQRLWKAGEP